MSSTFPDFHIINCLVGILAICILPCLKKSSVQFYLSKFTVQKENMYCVKCKRQTSHQSTIHLSWLITMVKRPGKFHAKPNSMMADGFADRGNLQTALRSAVFRTQRAWSWEYSLRKSAKHIGISCQCNMVIAAGSLVSVRALQDPCNLLPAVCSPARWYCTPHCNSQIVTSLISFMTSYLYKWSHGIRASQVNDHLSTSVRDSQSGRMLIGA